MQEDNKNINKELFKSYADIKNEIKKLTEQAEKIEETITQTLIENEIEKVESDFGMFSFTNRKKWSYPVEVLEAEKSYKEIKKESETNGTATFEETKSLTFRAK